MSRFVRVRVNRDLIATVEVNNESGGTDADSVNTYAWSFVGEGGRKLNGTVQHRYGDGALLLSHKVMGEVAVRYQVVAHLDHAAAIDGCPLCEAVAVAHA